MIIIFFHSSLIPIKFRENVHSSTSIRPFRCTSLEEKVLGQAKRQSRAEWF